MPCGPVLVVIFLCFPNEAAQARLRVDRHRDEQQPPPRPSERLVYQAGGLVILIGVIVVAPLSAVTYSLLVLETIMLASFGLSWFMKG